MRLSTRLLALIVSAAIATLSLAQEGGAGPEHDILKKFTGEWVSKSKSIAAEAMPEVQCSGTASYRMLGDLWTICELEGDMGGVTMHAIQTIGYDPAKKKYIGTWVDSMMNHMWKYEGTLNESGTILTMEAEGPNFNAPGKMAQFRDSYEFKSPDHIVATSSFQNEDGKWITFMVGDLTRKK